jgi:Putative adhesin
MGALMPSFETPEPITATIEVVAGHVRVTAGERTTTRVEVSPRDETDTEDVEAARLTRVEYGHGQLLVKAPRHRSWRPRGDGGGIDVTIQLPAGSEVRATAGLADFDCDGPLGDCRFKAGIGHIRIEQARTLSVKSGMGDVSLDRATGHVDITAGSGDVRVRELATSAVIKASNGDTWVGDVHGDVRLQSANGAIAVDHAHATLAAKSANGDVRLGELARGTVVLETQIGDVEVGIPEGTAAYLDVRASAGRVHNALEAAEAPDAEAETVEVRARTTAGDVVIRRP